MLSDFTEKKKAFFTLKTEFFSKSKNSYFSKVVNLCFWSKNANFPIFRFGQNKTRNNA